MCFLNLLFSVVAIGGWCKEYADLQAVLRRLTNLHKIANGVEGVNIDDGIIRGGNGNRPGEGIPFITLITRFHWLLMIPQLYVVVLSVGFAPNNSTACFPESTGTWRLCWMIVEVIGKLRSSDGQTN